MTIRVTVWNENVHERESDLVRGLYPAGIHGCIAEALNRAGGIDAGTATLEMPEHGLGGSRLDDTDVLIWWGHAAHGAVSDEVVERVTQAVWGGMGLICLHSAHFSKPFKRLMGTPCNLCWREAGERERLWSVAPNHPIAAGLPPHFDLEQEEMYGEPFGIPEPQETVFISWFQGGRGVPLRRHLAAGGGQGLLLPPGARGLSDLSRRACPAGDRQRRALGSQSRAPGSPMSTGRRTCRRIRRPNLCRRAARRSTRTATKVFR